MKKLTQSDYNSLSQEERILAQALGLSIDFSKATRKSHVKCSSGDPYILITKVACRLCQVNHVRIFRMLKSGNFLYSEEIAKIPPTSELADTKIKSSSYKVRFCDNCYNYLTNLHKGILVKKFLHYIKDSRNFLA